MIIFARNSSLWPIATQALVFLLGGITSLTAAGTLGAEKWAAITMFTSLAALSTLLSSLGVPTAVARGVGNPFRRGSAHIVVLSLLAFTILVVTVSSLIFWASDSNEVLSLQSMFFTLMASTCLHLLNEITLARFQSHKKFFELSILRIINVTSPGLALVIAALSNCQIVGILYAMILGQVIALVGGLTLTFFDTRKERLGHPNSQSVATSSLISKKYFQQVQPFGWLAGSLGLFISSIFLQLVFRSDIIWASFRQTSQTIGVLALALMLTEILWFVTNGIAIADFPRFSKMRADFSNFKLLNKSIAQSLLGAGFAMVLIGFGLPLMIDFVLTEGYNSLLTTYWLLVPGALAFIPVKLFLNLQMSRLRWRPVVALTSVVITLKILLNLSIPTQLGPQGPALVSTTAYIAGLVLMSVLVVRSRD